MKYSVHFIFEGRTVEVEAGTTLLQAQIASGLPADAPCGGKGTCRKCMVAYRAPGQTGWTRALACRTRVEGDLEVKLPGADESLKVMTEGVSAAATHASGAPMARAVRVTVPPCARGDSTSDWSRLCLALDEALEHRDWIPDMDALRGLGALLSRTKGDVWAVVCDGYVLEVRADEPRVLMAAFDLGTTSIAGYLVDARDSRVLVTGGMRNPQAQYGGDVISRADYALANGIREISACARKAIDGLCRHMCLEADLDWRQVYAMLVAGNTAMHHLFLGISPDSLVHAPYNPTLSGPMNLPARDYGLGAHPAARLFTLPVVGGFVGADTVACLISGDWLNRERLTLMIDIGTNGELVMGNRHRRLACSTAAGPALEGAKISCGMRGADGAIDHVWIEEGALRWHVIGEGAARGICGSGLVDLVAMLLETGELDESGRLEGGQYAIGDTGLALTQKDVREVQLAKAAIAAGVRLLAKKLGIALETIEEVDIAGAFGNYIDPDNACAIGLIPQELRPKIVPVGNAAGEGARLALSDAAAWASAEAIARTTEFLELATMAEFQDEFVEQLSFGEEDE